MCSRDLGRVVARGQETLSAQFYGSLFLGATIKSGMLNSIATLLSCAHCTFQRFEQRDRTGR